MNEEAAFLQAIKKNPKDRTARLVFVDLFREREDSLAVRAHDDQTALQQIGPGSASFRTGTQSGRKQLRLSKH